MWSLSESTEQDTGPVVLDWIAHFKMPVCVSILGLLKHPTIATCNLKDVSLRIICDIEFTSTLIKLLIIKCF